jgi:endonuclease YncB( thermonuclease family)
MSLTRPQMLVGTLALVGLAAGTPALLAQSAAKPDLGKLRRFEISRIIDAGTLALRSDGKTIDVHLAGVDVPDDEGDGDRAREFLEQLLLAESVYVEPIDHAEGTPPPLEKESRKQRTDARSARGAARADDAPTAAITDGSFVYAYRAPDGLFVNLELVRQAYVRVSARPKFDQLDAFRKQEAHARDAGKGVWARGRPAESKDPKSGSRGATGGEEPPRTGAKPDPKSGKPIDAAVEMVYVTKSGKKYHRQDCQFISHGSTAISLADAAKRGLEPCSRCKPPPKP